MNRHSSRLLVELERLRRDYTRACETGEDDTAIQARYRTLASQLADECERLAADNARLRALCGRAAFKLHGDPAGADDELLEELRNARALLAETEVDDE